MEEKTNDILIGEDNKKILLELTTQRKMVDQNIALICNTILNEKGRKETFMLSPDCSKLIVQKSEETKETKEDPRERQIKNLMR